MRTVLAVARATVRLLKHHLSICMGGRGVAGAVCCFGVAVLAVINGFAYQLMATEVPDLYSATYDAVIGSERIAAARSALPMSSALMSALFALSFVSIMPRSSPLVTAARLQGGATISVALGEFLPVVMGAYGVGLSACGGVMMFLARSSGEGGWVSIGLAAFVTAMIGLVVACHQLLTAAFACAMDEHVSATLSATVVFFIAAMVAADLVGQTLAGQVGYLGYVWGFIWRADLPSTPWSVIKTMSVSLLFASMAFGARVCVVRPPLGRRHRRLVPSVMLGPSASWWNGVIRQVALCLRHSVCQAGILVSACLVGMLVAASGARLLPADLVLLAIAMIQASLLETAFGRQRPYAWLNAAAGLDCSTGMLQAWFGGVIVALPGYVIPLGMLISHLSEPVWTHVLLFVALTMVCYFAGVVVPYDERVPVGIIATSMVAIGLESAVLFAVSRMPGPVWSAGVICALMVLGMWGAWWLTEQRSS